MTAENNDIQIASNSSSTTTNTCSNTQPATAATNQSSASLPPEIKEMCEFLSDNNKIIFKSQQIDDPELQRSEKVQIAKDLYAKNRQTFLMRFGAYLEERHLNAFTQLAISEPLNADESGEEMQLLLRDYRSRLRTRQRDVKNRRYVAMQRLIEEGEYFSETEMMRRAPELYQELIGQYLSEEEKKQRDEYDVKNTTFSGILMHTMEQKELQDVLKQADRENDESEKLITDEEKEEEDDKSSEENNESIEDEVPVAFRQQWGNFDNEQVACSSSHRTQEKPAVKKSSQRSVGLKTKTACLITAGERNLLRQEFVGLMHEQFLSGNDADFDYTQVDDNSQLDDLSQLNQDKEDAYFEESESETEVAPIENRMYDEASEESEDELDLFMSHLSQHHSLQRQSN